MNRTSLLVLLALASCTAKEPALSTTGAELELEEEELAPPARVASASREQSEAPSAAPASAAAPASTPTEDRDLADQEVATSEAEPMMAAPRMASGRSRGKREEAKPRRSDRAQQVAAPVGGAVAPPPPAPDPVAAQGVMVPEVDATGADTFTHHGVNPMTLVEEDAQSTFSIDVDTASYALSRRSLLGNQLPPEAAVRVEEFVNYFDYDYAQPSQDPFAVDMEAMPDPFRPGHHVLRVGVQGKELSQDERPPLHLVFLVDVSGSMSSADKLGLAKESLHMLVDNLREDDTVALATYAGRVAQVLEPTAASHKQRIHQAIRALKSGGSTAMSSGIDLAYQMADETFVTGHENRVVVLSDGDANVGRTSWDDMLGQIKGYADKGVTLSTIGFGRGNYRDTLMEQLANKGDGNNYYIDDDIQAKRVFVDELGGTLVTIARDVKLQVEFNPEAVAAYRLIGYENRDIADKDFRNDRVDAGEVGSGHNVTALYDVVLKDGYSRELATVRMRWEAPGADKAATERAFPFASTQLRETPALASKDLRIAYTAGTFAEVLRGSGYAAEISLAELAAFGEGARRRGQDDKELLHLIRTADQLGAGARAMATASR